MRQHAVKLGLMLIWCLLVSCTGRYTMKRSTLAIPSVWPNPRGDIAATGAIGHSEYAGGLDLIWKEKVSDRPVGALTLTHGQLAVPGSRKRIWFFDSQTGSKLGKLKAGGVPQGGINVADSLGYVNLAAPRDRLLCFDLIHKRIRWQLRVKDAASGPIIVDNRLVIGSSDGTVTSSDPKTGKQLWRFATGDRLLGPLSASTGRIFVGSADGTLFSLAAPDGKELYRVKLKGPIVSAVAIAEYVYVANSEGELVACRQHDGSVAWRVTLPSSTWAAPAVSDNRVVIACRNGDVVAYDASIGVSLWKYAAVDVVKASPIVIGKCVVVGTMSAKLLTLNSETGELVNQAVLEGAVAFSPVSDGSRVFVATQTGRIYCFGDSHEQR